MHLIGCVDAYGFVYYLEMNGGKLVRSLDDIMRQELTRAEFLKLVGIAAISAFGVTGLLANLSERTYIVKKSTPGQRIAQRGFGTRKFGE